MPNQLAIRSSSQLAVRSKIDALQDAMLAEVSKGTMEQTIVDCKEDNSQADHYYGEGVYCRSLLIPEGTAVVGHIHKQDRVCIIAQGKCTFTDEFHTETVEAPYIGEFKAGTKTAVYAHTDTLWVACLGADNRDPDKLVSNLLADNYEDYEMYLKLEGETT